jgi:hypothetical protein
VQRRHVLVRDPASACRFGGRFPWRPVLSAASLAATIALDARDARADSCTSPDLIEVTPPDQAQEVPTNAMLFARYASIAQYQGEGVQLEHVGVDMQSVPAMFDDTDGMLSITPPAPLVPAGAYVVHWPGLRGLNTATLGTGSDQHISVGAAQDVARPTFEGISGVTWDVAREKDSCTSSINERYVFDLALGAAADDSGRDSLTLLVFQTQGPKVDAGTPTRVLVRRIPPAGQTVRVTSTVDRAIGHVCFAAIVQDLTLKVSTTSAEKCVDTVTPPFFYSCAVAPTRGPGHGGMLLLLATQLALARRKGRRRRDGA